MATLVGYTGEYTCGTATGPHRHLPPLWRYTRRHTAELGAGEIHQGADFFVAGRIERTRRIYEEGTHAEQEVQWGVVERILAVIGTGGPSAHSYPLLPVGIREVEDNREITSPYYT
eukprot:3653125-Pyramimonas_sp.AAC.1